MIDFGLVKKYSQEERDRVLKSELPEEKLKLLKKYNLTCNENLYWERVQHKYKTQEFFSHRLVRKCSTLAIIMHMYKLCIAKINYFEKNWEYYYPCKYNWKNGKFEKCELYDIEFIGQKHTNIIIDLRNLSEIHEIEAFRSMCEELEKKIKGNIEKAI